MPQGRTGWVSLSLLLIGLIIRTFAHCCSFIDRDLIGTAHQQLMHSQPSLPSQAFYAAPVLEDGPNGVLMQIRVSPLWATRMVDKAHGTLQVDGPIVSAPVSPLYAPLMPLREPY